MSSLRVLVLSTLLAALGASSLAQQGADPLSTGPRGLTELPARRATSAQAGRQFGQAARPGVQRVGALLG